MDRKSGYGGLDVCRIIAAILVVAIHTSPLTSVSGDADFFLTGILARTAVPFFFMITGQFVLTQDFQKVWKYVQKVAVLYGIAIFIYIPIGIYAGHYQKITVLKLLRMLVFDGTFYHLWYFPACITGVLLVYGMRRCMGQRSMLVTAGILYILGLSGDSYFGLIEDVPVLSDIYDAGFQIFSYTRNGIFFAPVFLILGEEIGKKKFSVRLKIQGVGLAFSFLLMTAEGFLLRHFQIQRHDSMYIFLIPTMAFLYQLILSWEKKPSKMLRTAGTWIYILHPAVIVVVRGMAKVLHMTTWAVDNSLFHYFIVTALSLGISFMIAAFLTKVKVQEFNRGRAWIELNREALRQNVEMLQKRLPGHCRLMPAVKADAYGHGAVLVAKELNQMGIDAFCVACVKEGVELRKQGIRGEILVLGYTHPREFCLLYRYHLTQTVVDYLYAVQLNSYGKKIMVHLGIDTGMHRLGERSENFERICRMFQMKNLMIRGMFTHLCADDTLAQRQQEYTIAQAEEFYRVAERLRKQGYSCPKLHMQSSYGVLNYPELAEDYARIGIALYGVLSTKEDTEKWRDILHPVLSLKARVASVKTLYAGESAGYGLDFRAKGDRKIAVLAIGYADGLPRALSNGKGEVLIHGCRASIAGRICMDQTIVDVTDVPCVKTGDIAVLIGSSGKEEISACDLAEWSGTIANEILSRTGARLERFVNSEKYYH